MSQALNKDEVNVSLEEEDAKDEGPTVSILKSSMLWKRHYGGMRYRKSVYLRITLF